MVKVIAFVLAVLGLIVVAATYAAADGIGTPCASATNGTGDCYYADPTVPGSTDCDPGVLYCVLTCPVCGAGNTCAIVGFDDSGVVEACEGPQCGNANVVCDPSYSACDIGNDCAYPCQLNGKFLYRPGTNCEARGLQTEKATGRCFIDCQSDECSIIGDNYCGLPFDESTPAARARTKQRIRAAKQNLAGGYRRGQFPGHYHPFAPLPFHR